MTNIMFMSFQIEELGLSKDSMTTYQELFMLVENAIENSANSNS